MDNAELHKSLKEKEDKSEGKNKRLPLYGPLSIEDLQEFYKKAREQFKVMYTQISHDIVDIEDFYALEVLGTGAFGKVLLVQDKTEEAKVYAMKAIEKGATVKSKQVEHALNEKRILQSVDFPFGVRLEYFSKDHKYIYFFMPYIPGGEMYTHLQSRGVFDEGTSRFFAAQVLLGLEYLHNMKIIYRDMKPENLLLDCFGYLKITDFGFSKPVLHRTYTFCGTPQYLAPEIIQGHGYGHAVDWWGLGVLIYEMNAGYPPFNGRSNIVLFQSITKGRYVVPINFSHDLRDIISKLLEINLAKRYGNLKGGPLDIKNHEWFKTINWLAVFNRKMTSPLVPPCRQLSDYVIKPTRTLVDDQLVKNESMENEFEDEFKHF